MIYLDKTGLLYFWTKIKLNLTKIDNYTINGKKISTNPVITKADIGLGNVENVKAIPESLIGAENGVAELDENGLVRSSQLPSYIDDVLEFDDNVSVSPSAIQAMSISEVKHIGYNTQTKTFIFTANPLMTGSVTWASNTTNGDSWGTDSSTGRKPRASAIYVNIKNNKTYRWSGTDLVEISPSITLGTTSSTAFYGDKGQKAYTHANAKGSAYKIGLYKIQTNDEGHVINASVVTKSDLTALGVADSASMTPISNSEIDTIAK